MAAVSRSAGLMRVPYLTAVDATRTVLISSFHNAASVPLTEPLPGIPELRPAGDLPKPYTQITTLDNGVRVASEESYGQVSNVTAFLAAGSMYETPEEYGVSHFLELSAFKSTPSRSTDAIHSLARAEGLTCTAATSREVMAYRADCVRSATPLAVELLADTIRNPNLTEAEVEHARRVVEFQYYQLADNPQQVVQELLHAAAYGQGTPLGHTTMCPAEQINVISSEMLHNFREQHYSPDRLVVAAAGVDHDAFVRQVDAAFGDMQPSQFHTQDQRPDLGASLYGADSDSSEGQTASSHSSVPRPSQAYHGGMVTANASQSNGMPLEFGHLVVAFPTVGWTSADVVPMCVLDTLLGGGSSFSAGGPGKGMYSRLYRQVLNAFSWVDSANAFTLQFDHHGLFGMYGSAAPQDLRLLLQVLASQLNALKRVPVTEVELARARNQLASSVMMNLEMKSIQCEDIGRQVLVLNRRLDPTELVARVQAVTAEDLQRVAQKALANPPSIAVLGDTSFFPEYEEVKAILAGESASQPSFMNILQSLQSR